MRLSYNTNLKISKERSQWQYKNTEYWTWEGNSEVPLGSLLHHYSEFNYLIYKTTTGPPHCVEEIQTVNDTYHIVGLRLSNKDQYVWADYR